VYLSIDVFALAVDDILAVERIVILQWIIRPKTVGIDRQRLLLAARQQESNRRFVSGFRRNHVPLPRATISHDNALPKQIVGRLELAL
jgi:hypothetical protein